MKTAVIGTGHIARQHLACLRTLPDVQIVGVCDLSPALAESTAERYGVPVFFTNHREMLATVRPDVVHVTTPPQSHFALALDALAAGAHVVVEKPLTADPVQVEKLLAVAETAATRGQHLVEDYNYLYNAPVLELRRQLASGDLGAVVHVEVFICLDILGKDSRFADPNLPHPCLRLPGGAIYDFLTHFAYLAHAFAGPLQATPTAAGPGVQCVWSKRTADSPLPADEFRALINGTRAPSVLGFSAHGQPDVFWLRVYTTKARVALNLFEQRLTIERLRKVPRPLISLINGWQEGRAIRQAATRSLWRKLSGGPGAYEGLWTFLKQTYAQWQRPPSAPPDPVLGGVTLQQIREVNALLGALSATAPAVSSASSGSPSPEKGAA